MITSGSGLLALNWACTVRDSWDVILGIHQHSVDHGGMDSCKLDLGGYLHSLINYHLQTLKEPQKTHLQLRKKLAAQLKWLFPPVTMRISQYDGCETP